ncbi:unnamed protein product [Vitrella brassicaformis CCMP3155]|uniref:Oxidation resistance protein 1 n=2 Tax=Vitrella brassicaformis TaxID=1169539 RepID=A0A0G4ELN0_VITBC|nr:unnamed protein product [Vitrella brassicaformis CCMP3155]|eukprot:CEL98333.1 unnamed protein product [Vitrella brassicaformis CCMP3155]
MSDLGRSDAQGDLEGDWMWATASAEEHHERHYSQTQVAAAAAVTVNHENAHHQPQTEWESNDLGGGLTTDSHHNDAEWPFLNHGLVVMERAGEVAIGERLQLVDEFIRRQQSGESINMSQFAKEKGIPPKRFRQWCYATKKQREEGKQIVDSDKKRNRPPKYQQIEDDMRQWMATHDDPTSVPPKAIRAKAMEIAIRLGVTGFSASDKWIKTFRKRCQQIPLPSSEPPAAAAAAAAVDPPFPMRPPHPHPLPRPLTHQSEAASADAAAAAADIQVADGFIGPMTDLSRQTPTCPLDDDAAAARNRPLDQQSQHSGQNTMSMAPSESRLTNERPPNKIQRTPTRSHREGPPSVVWSRSSAKSVFTMTADDSLSDIAEDGDDMISVSDGAVGHVMAVSIRSTTDEDDKLHDPQMIVGSSLSEAECAGLHSWLVPSVFDELGFTLLYRASRDGSSYADLLHCVGDNTGLLFIIRKDIYVFGVYISAGIQPPAKPTGVDGYECDMWHFSLAGHFAKGPTKLWECRQCVWVAGRGGTVDGAKLGIGGFGGCLWLGCGAADDMRSCGHSIWSLDVPEGYVGLRSKRGRAVFGGGEYFTADEVEVIRLDGRSLLSLKVVEGAAFAPLQSAALYRFLGATSENSLKLIYRASHDGPSYGDLLRCVGDTKNLVFLIRKDKYVFGAFISANIQVPDDPTGYKKKYYWCDVWYFSLAGHFAKGPTKMGEGWLPVRVAGREGTVGGAKVRVGWWLWLGCEGGARTDMRRCRQSIHRKDVPEGYVGVRRKGNALFGGSRDFMADEVDVFVV